MFKLLSIQMRGQQLHDGKRHDIGIPGGRLRQIRYDTFKQILLEGVGKRELAIGRYAVVFGQRHGKPAFHSPALNDYDFRGKR